VPITPRKSLFSKWLKNLKNGPKLGRKKAKIFFFSPLGVSKEKSVEETDLNSGFLLMIVYIR